MLRRSRLRDDFYDAQGRLKMAQRFPVQPAPLAALLRAAKHLTPDAAAQLQALLGLMLVYEPQKRGTAAALLRHDFLTAPGRAAAGTGGGRRGKAAAVKK